MLSLFFLAHAGESPPQDVVLSEDIPLFTDVGIDSGWVPNTGRLGVKLELLANGTAYVDQEGSARLTWPEGLNLRMIGEELGGYLVLETVLESIVSIRFDIASYQWESPIATNQQTFSADMSFDSFALNEPLSLIAEDNSNTVINYETKVLFVVDVKFYGVLQPQCILNFEGLEWNIEDETITSEDEAAIFDPVLSAPDFTADAKYLAQVDAELSFNFIPTFEVCVPIGGCFDWEIVEIPISSSTDTFVHEFTPVPLQYDLPSMQLEMEEIDLGTVEVGELINYAVPIKNIGYLMLEGTAALQGREEFTVFPEYFLANTDQEDGVMIAFMAQEEGDYGTVLQLVSNDPAQNIVEIPIAIKVIPKVEESTNGSGVDGEDIESQPVGGCGCATQQDLPLAWLTVLGVFSFLRRKT